MYTALSDQFEKIKIEETRSENKFCEAIKKKCMEIYRIMIDKEI